MPDPVAPMPPRTLYTQLRECASTTARAQAVLEFVRACTASEAGHLFLPSAGELAHAASSSGMPPAPELIAEAKRTWDRELDRQPDDNKTLELSAIKSLLQAQESALWKNPAGELFERRLLSIYRSTGWVPVGLIMLKTREGGSLQPIRQVYIEAVCNALLDAGDVPAHSISTQLS